MTSTTLARVTTVGDTAFNVEFGDAVDRDVNARVMSLYDAVNREGAKGRLAGLVEAVPTFRSLLVTYDPLATNRGEMEAAVLALASGIENADRTTGRSWRIPVSYGGELGPDLEEVASLCKLTPQQVIARHSAPRYFVYMLGFMPGFAYLGDVPEELRLPRRATPRLKVPPGSVAIAAELSTVYPWESPGGWHLLGRTPVAFFDLSREPPVLVQAGDQVQFYPIDRDEFDRLSFEDPAALATDKLLVRGD